jgi:hypothetical protein
MFARPFDVTRSRSPAQHPKTEKAELMPKAKTRQDDRAKRTRCPGL